MHAAKPSKAERKDMKREDMGGASASPNRTPAEDAQARNLSKLREQLEITDDTEWEVVGERITRVNDLRREAAATAGLKPTLQLSDKAKKSPGTAAHPEQDALRSAVRDKLPDAEVKLRLARAHEVHLQNEAKLIRAQDALRAVLTVRQEAVLVTAGLLPP